MKKADPPLHIHIPSASADQPSWMRVGAIAVIGFAVGIAWPRLAGVRLGPNAPTSASSAPESAAPAKPLASSAARVPEAPTASLVAPAATPPVASAAPAEAASAAAALATGNAGPTSITVKPGIMLSCRTEAGETLKGKACGALPFDAIALPKLRRLAGCPATAGNEGNLSVQFHLDFPNNKLTARMGSKNTVGNVDSFSACVGTIFEKVSINAVTHEHAKYSMLYNVVFAPGTGDGGGKPRATAGANSAANAGGSSAAAAASEGGGGEAKIAWDVAVVRDTPRTGAIVGRIQRGTPVQVLATENNWYKVRAGTTEGWLYRGAIAR